MKSQKAVLLQAIGPGIILAGSSVGVSHLVQSTRAGADYGLALAIPVLLAMALKYPAFRFATHYSATTGNTLIEGYRNIGKAWLWIYVLFLSLTAIFATAAISMLTGALAVVAFKLQISVQLATVLIMLFSMALVSFGHFKWLERIMKAFVLLFTLLTLFAVILIVPDINLDKASIIGFREWKFADFAFLVALLGWMPTPIEVTVQQSLWTSAKIRQSAIRLPLAPLIQDFNIGYFGTAFLAICFILMGAALIHGNNIPVPDNPVEFSTLLISLYEQSIGDWIGPLIGVCAFSIMLSTMLTIFDGLPRTFGAVAVLLIHNESYEAAEPKVRYFWFKLSSITICVLALSVMFLLIDSFKQYIDMITTASFIAAPLFAWLNQRAVTSTDIPQDQRPSHALLLLNYLGIVSMVLMACGLIYINALN